jgi:hypothetical protein
MMESPAKKMAPIKVFYRLLLPNFMIDHWMLGSFLRSSQTAMSRSCMSAKISGDDDAGIRRRTTTAATTAAAATTTAATTTTATTTRLTAS